MSRLYISWQEDEAYRQGKRDAHYGSRDISRTPKSFAEHDSPDRAYWDGYDDFRKEEQDRNRRNEEQQEEYDAEYERWRRGL